MMTNKKSVNNIRQKQIFSIATAIVTLLANIAMILLLIWSFRYAGLDGKIFFSVFGIVICLLVILNLIFFVGYNHRDNLLKMITCGVSVVLLLIGGVGSYYVTRLNRAVDNMIENTDGEMYETVRVAITTYKNSSIQEVSDLNGKKVGSLIPSGVSAATVGREYLEKEGIEVSYKDYNMTSDLFQALTEGEIDAAIFPNIYRSQLTSADEAFEELLNDANDIYTFEEKVKTADSGSSKKDLSVEPFTILLIGYAPEEGGGGLTDTIILASVNPQTMSVTMTSIPRDSYVPISCYNNSRSKINDAGAASKACLMETVGNLLDVEVDFYMEVNFQGLVDIVDALGGIYIDSPVEFVGQTASSSRGSYTVWVPAGPYTANGEQALAFARERYAMPNGDFDRQVHQQEVIAEIAKKLIELRDVNKAIEVMEAAGENFSTNLSLSQLTGVFNYIVNAPNYTGLPQFNLVDIKNSRVTGYTRWFYSYAMRLPLWSYYLWDGSIKDNVALLDETLGHYTSIDQDDYFKFFVEYPYGRGKLYHEYYDEPRVPEDMPPYYPRLYQMSYSEAMAWAAANGVNLEVITIEEGDAGYDPNAIGRVIDQYPAYGQLVSDFPSGSITVIGSPLDDEDRVPDFKGRSIDEVYSWANSNGYSVTANKVSNSDPSRAGKVTEQDIAPGTDKSKQSSITVSYYEVPGISVGDLDSGLRKWMEADAKKWADSKGVSYSVEYVEDNNYQPGILIRYSYNTDEPNIHSRFTFYIAKAKEEVKPTPTPSEPGTSESSKPTTPPETSEPTETTPPEPSEPSMPSESPDTSTPTEPETPIVPEESEGDDDLVEPKPPVEEDSQEESEIQA